MNTTSAWYIRNHLDGEVKGPFPRGQIVQEILLGRHKLDDEVSHDKEEWFLIREIPELIPEVLQDDPNNPETPERLAAARRWADERRGMADIDHNERRAGGESYEKEEIKRLHKLSNTSKAQTTSKSMFIQLASVFLVITAIIVLAFQYSPAEKGTVDCSDPIGQGVNWSGCNLSGADLSNASLMAANLMNVNLQTANLQSADLSLANLKYAQLHLTNLKYVNFTKANLTGANLMGADLSQAILQQANLRYVNFRDAIILTTDFTNARLDNAVWIDGRTCAKGSIGQCN